MMVDHMVAGKWLTCGSEQNGVTQIIIMGYTEKWLSGSPFRGDRGSYFDRKKIGAFSPEPSHLSHSKDNNMIYIYLQPLDVSQTCATHEPLVSHYRASEIGKEVNQI